MEEAFANHPDMIRLFGERRPPVFCTPTRLQTQDGEYDCFLEGDKVSIYKWVLRDGVKVRYRYLSDNHGAGYGIPPMLQEGATLWQHAPSDSMHATHVLVVDAMGKAIASRECGASNHLVRLDSKGVPNGQVLVNPEQLPEEIRFYVSKVSNPTRTLLWAEQGKDSQWRLTTIEYPDVRLSFSIHHQPQPPHSIAVCTAFPDCVLDDTQGVAFNGLEGAIRLRDSAGKPRLIVPCTQYDNRSNYLNGSETSPGAYFVYDYNPEGRTHP